jgi:hypothetical protein
VRRLVTRRGATRALACTALLATTLAAQQREPVIGVRGTVTDDRGTPLGDVRVELDDGTAARSDSAGRFAIVARRCGEPARLTARRIGSAGVTRTIVPCTAPALDLALVLRPVAQVLGTVQVTADASAITGQVVDRTGRPVPGATVRLAGARRVVTSDSTGSFTFAGLDPANYWLEARHPRHATQRLPITLVARDVREVLLLLDDVPNTDAGRLARRERDDSLALANYDLRRVARGAWTAVIPRTTLLANDDGRDQLTCALARTPEARGAFTNLTVGNCLEYEACVMIDGRFLTRNEALWGYRTSDVELVELYGTRVAQSLLRGFGALPCEGQPTAVVWLRR